MNFVSWAFLLLFALVVFARLTIGRRKIEPAYVAVLIMASTVFYAWHIPVYIVILLVSSAIDYVAAIAIYDTPIHQQTRRRVLLAISLTSNLGVLGFFKYGGFALRVYHDLFGAAGQAPPEFALALPMGISFYTFQSMSYTIDVYRQHLVPLRRFAPFYLFIAFFPQLVAGPIVRAVEFLPQIPRPRRLRAAVVYQGLWLIIGGFFLKMVCADNLAVYVDEHWQRVTRDDGTSASALWLSLMFSGQIFADFAGYSNIARGTALILGYRLPVNFDAPYLAASFKNFWERWHMTLSRWLRDYLYVGLGGNRRGRLRTYLNLLLVMLLGGLWHGAAYTFIVWGAIHGVALAIERLLGLHQDRPGLAGRIARVAWFFVVQGTVLTAWVFFRSPSVEEAWYLLSNVLVFDGWPLGPMEWVGALFLLPIVALHLFTWLKERRLVTEPTVTAKAVLAAGMVYAILTLYAGTADFIYFQF